ncbi:hypothetical protein A3K29_01600 [Candidatus Collierbacteria bacterium RIFOXYB2_FULL_46_14]|uniref:Uncharacterized protein n=1 Tax=Candidatus Collierbacteria bacterium GW2011_GWA2_46_26 TaxID=1618381 RepID=A0A0G1SHP2_9BACT|nr:MAG: hypothetical protein UW29_C0006G0059 [Candidatus Collierbacteria bacterium GW2011_GWC2_44_13]KKU32845.1 MAG: hypothetical protein UX47_C0007G0089 [Candidatus Collierbacteria bacterium GW2011_GWA2_46_26]OGD72825.1 MAG: hypothetical protein A3K29_01600 [Candidatus Collierbacteria bacterium RIFOXYB2_FULL_46_14]OGD75867.1 MAG: hypothetical protein A3K43_01600 [Candidatus Collierbacteria bacterium RIFOXYA2_FULL_46_20]OGD77203.1 MAG: hypothetical protein A3K39_01600 [Candidatus Collierbacteri
MKRFWLGAIRSLAIRMTLLTVVIHVFNLWNFWAVPWAFGLAFLTVAVRFGVEYWAMNRTAERFGVNLEFLARVRYELKWDLLSIRLNEEAFRAELEKRKLSWMRDEK